MKGKVYLTHKDCRKRALMVVSVRLLHEPLNVYPIPRGGVPVAYLLRDLAPTCTIVDTPEEADIFIDDIIDSGATQKRYVEKYNKPFYALVDKVDNVSDKALGWVVFPWEVKENGSDESIEDNVRRILQSVDPEPDREGIAETPARVAKAWKHWTGGYHIKPEDLLKVFEDGADNYDQMIIVKDIPIYSKCEHHLADIFGTATIAYIPDGNIVGLSKLSRLADMYARRLQVQERLTVQIADAIEEHLKPKGVGVIIRARHMCMESRGICQQGHHTITSALRGVIAKEPEARSEFMLLSK